MNLVKIAIVVAVAAGTAVPALGCEYDPFLFVLPGESVAQANERSEAILSDYKVKAHYEREQADYETASSVYIGRVLSVSRTKSSPSAPLRISADVKPVHALKGSLPKQDRTLTDEPPGGMCTDIGDGEGARANKGDWVVVFEGVPKSQARPRGIDSFGVSSIRTLELLDKVRAFGKDIE